MGISSDKPIVLIGATSIHAPYKGLELFMESMALFPEDKYLVLVFGKCQQGWSVGLKQEIKELGYLADSTSLRLAYSAADVFVAPSKMEAFGKTLVEAMACQTPTVCFNACGPRDIVDHKITGYKARAFDSSDLARGIDWVIGANVDGALGKAAESAASKCFEKSVIAKRYVALYENLLEQ
ncbi:MAG: glycosyltransferase [Cellvibrionaceae bacterium]